LRPVAPLSWPKPIPGNQFIFDVFKQRNLPRERLIMHPAGPLRECINTRPTFVLEKSPDFLCFAIEPAFAAPELRLIRQISTFSATKKSEDAGV
jgi:hypothetical protein